MVERFWKCINLIIIIIKKTLLSLVDTYRATNLHCFLLKIRIPSVHSRRSRKDNSAVFYLQWKIGFSILLKVSNK